MLETVLWKQLTSIAAGWERSSSGRELHPLKASAFSRRTFLPIENAPQSTKRILDTLHAMCRKSRTVDKARLLRGRSQHSSRYLSVQRHQFDRRKSDGGTSTLDGIALEKGALLHELGFLQEIALGRAAQDALRHHYPICRNRAVPNRK
jgi:hypothetical protein